MSCYIEKNRSPRKNIVEFIEFIDRTEVEIIRMIEKEWSPRRNKLSSIKTTDVENIPIIYAN